VVFLIFDERRFGIEDVWIGILFNLAVGKDEIFAVKEVREILVVDRGHWD